MKKIGMILFAIVSLAGGACGWPSVDISAVPEPSQDLQIPSGSMHQSAVFSGGCFWCTEAVYEQVEGVTDVVSGYAGGKPEDATYRSVSSGKTDHAEVIRITYDPNRTTYGRLLKVFFAVAHDPTQLNRQGPDIGHQYRSAIFHESIEQKQVADAYIRQLEEAKVFDRAIVTTLEPLEQFFPAEPNHQNFVHLNPNHPYVRQHALPKVRKVRKHFANHVREQ